MAATVPQRPDDRLFGGMLPAILAVSALCYTLVTTAGGDWAGFARVDHGLTFNSMLAHLLSGRFDVDPASVGPEGFTRDGRVYAYWGPFPALVRLPLLAKWPVWKDVDVTLLSCLAAAVTMLAIKLRALQTIAAARPEVPRGALLAVALALVLSGAQFAFLKASIYQEVCLWAGVFGALFVAQGIVGALIGFSRRVLTVMALAAAGVLLTRVSVAVGLFAALGLLIAVLFARRRVRLVELAPAVLVLAAAMATTGVVNYGRWGDPLTFADYSLYNLNGQFPDRMARTQLYGLFNAERIPFGLMYFFAPLWVLRGADGQLWFSATRDRLLDAIELPPSSFFLTDPLLLALGVVAIAAMLRRGPVAWPRAEMAALVAGLSASALLMLMAISMNYRYRIDFYPAFEMAAFAGLATLRWTRLRVMAACGLAVVGVAGSHAVLWMYRLSIFGPAQQHLGNGIYAFYEPFLRGWF